MIKTIYRIKIFGIWVTVNEKVFNSHVILMDFLGV